MQITLWSSWNFDGSPKNQLLLSQSNMVVYNLLSRLYLFHVLKALLALLKRYPSIAMPLSASTLYSSLVSSFEKSWAREQRRERTRWKERKRKSKKTGRNNRINIRMRSLIRRQSLVVCKQLLPEAFSAFAKRPKWEQWPHFIQATLSADWMIVKTATQCTRVALDWSLKWKWRLEKLNWMAGVDKNYNNK